MHYSRFTIRFKWLPIALLLFSGCQQDDPVESEDQLYIRFMPEDVATKALPKEIFAEGDQVGIIQYLYVVNEQGNVSGTSDWDTKKVQIKPDVDFYNKNGFYKDGLLDYGKAKAWSEIAEDQYTFFAYYPSTESDKDISISDKNLIGAPFLTYRLPYEVKTDETAKHDFSKVKDLMAASRFNHKKKYGAVKLVFNHLLSCVDFAIHNLNTSNKIRLLSLELSGSFYQEIKVNMETLAFEKSSTSNYVFPILSNSCDFSSTLTGGAESIGKQEKNYLFIIPQSMPGDWSVSATWQVLDNQGNPINADKTNAISIPVGSKLTFLPGKKHTFTLNFLGDVCTITSQHTDWETPDGEDNNIEFE
ncbi:MAG: fimbrillin family protein [Bacteroidales bacterium]